MMGPIAVIIDDLMIRSDFVSLSRGITEFLRDRAAAAQPHRA